MGWPLSSLPEALTESALTYCPQPTSFSHSASLCLGGLRGSDGDHLHTGQPSSLVVKTIWAKGLVGRVWLQVPVQLFSS